MKPPAYRDRDDVFGQLMLTLRSGMRLSQAELAAQLGVTRRSVVMWEAGESYPKAERLQDLIRLAFRQQRFQVGREGDEIRALWKAARQKLRLDERWLAELLADAAPALPVPVAEPDAALTADDARFDWDRAALDVTRFYGREWELGVLTDWVVAEQCRMVGVLGMGGIGKSALSVAFMQSVAAQFDVVIWRSLRDAPTCESLLDDFLRRLSPLAQTPADLDQRLRLLIEVLRRRRVLLVLDNLETLLDEGEKSGHMRAGYEGYDTLLRRLGEVEHRGCLLFTSRENPASLAALEGNQTQVRSLRLNPLKSRPCEQLLAEKGLTGSDAEHARLIDAYGGNPLALKIVAQTIADLFQGDIGVFLAQGEIIFGSVRTLLMEQFARLSPLEQSLLLWLAILREPATLDEVAAALTQPVGRIRLLEAIQALYRRSLVERGHKGTFTLQSVVLEYVTTRLIEEVDAEIQSGHLLRLIDYGLALAQAREYVRQTQHRLIVAPVLAHLLEHYWVAETVERKLVGLLDGLRALPPDRQGYGATNALVLLRALRGHLRGLDLSGLALRGAYLQGVDLQDTSLRGATIHDCVFTENFDALTAVTIRSDGSEWAAASRQGELRLWTAGGQVLQRAWRAHTGNIRALAFSPDGKALASGSWDGMVKVWEKTGAMLKWQGQHSSHVNRVAFSLDGQWLASGGNDALVRLWDARTGALLQTLEHPAPVTVVAWSPDGRLLLSADLVGTIRLWQVGRWALMQTLEAHTACVDDLAFSPDGQTLASASWDRAVRLWQVGTWALLDTLTAHSDRVFRLAWSPDGLTLASAGRDQVIWLWDVARRSYRAALHGHGAPVDGLAFTPNNHSLLSASEDGTLRVWDAASEQCARIVQGYATSYYDVDWSPDGSQLVSGGSDALVTIYDVGSGAPTRVLTGHHSVVVSVGWSRAGKGLASCEWDHVIRLWDAATGDAIQLLRIPDDIFFCKLAWSPDGRRVAGATFRGGVQVFDLSGRTEAWTAPELPLWIRPLAWSPDGSLLAGGGDDGVVYIWETARGALIQSLRGHERMILGVAWNLDGTKLASCSDGPLGGAVFIWDAQTWTRARSLFGHVATAYSLAWGPTDDVVISGGADGRLRWWNVETGECLRVTEAHQGTVSLRRSPDGTRLASCGDDGSIRVWDLGTGASLKTLRRDRPFERMDITGLQGLNEAQRLTLRALGAVEG